MAFLIGPAHGIVAACTMAAELAGYTCVCAHAHPLAANIGLAAARSAGPVLPPRKLSVVQESLISTHNILSKMKNRPM